MPSSPRTRPCAGWPTWPGSGCGRWRLRPGRDGRQPVGPGRGPSRGPAGRADDPPQRWVIAGTDHAHSSIVSACQVMDVDLSPCRSRVTAVSPGRPWRMRWTGPDTRVSSPWSPPPAPRTWGSSTTSSPCARGLRRTRALVPRGRRIRLRAWRAPSVRHRFDGIERADSFVVDPHKWLFAPFDCCALLYRDPALARAAHTQRAGYLDVLTEGGDVNPSDYAIGLTRRARGLPFWFSLAVHGNRRVHRGDGTHSRRGPVRSRGGPSSATWT